MICFYHFNRADPWKDGAVGMVFRSLLIECGDVPIPGQSSSDRPLDVRALCPVWCTACVEEAVDRVVSPACCSMGHNGRVQWVDMPLDSAGELVAGAIG